MIILLKDLLSTRSLYYNMLICSRIWEDNIGPGCFSDDFFGVTIPDYPISSCPILSANINPSFNLNFIPPVQFFILSSSQPSMYSFLKHVNHILQNITKLMKKIAFNSKLPSYKTFKSKRYLPFAISLNLNLHTSNDPNEFAKIHLVSSSKTVLI